MKGYAKVSIAIVEQAVFAFKEKVDKANKLADRATQDFYDKEYTPPSAWSMKYLRRKVKTPKEFLNSHLHSYWYWFEILVKAKVITDDEWDLLHWEHHSPEHEYKACKALIKNSKEDYVYLDNELCSFVNKYKPEVQGVYDTASGTVLQSTNE